MDRVQRLESAVGRFSSKRQKVAKELLARLRACLSEGSTELAKVSLDVIEFMGHDTTKAREHLAGFNSQELASVNRWLSIVYWRQDGGLFGGSVASSLDLLVQASI